MTNIFLGMGDDGVDRWRGEGCGAEEEEVEEDAEDKGGEGVSGFPAGEERSVGRGRWGVVAGEDPAPREQRWLYCAEERGWQGEKREELRGDGQTGAFWDSDEGQKWS